jgi:hypothetical protein
MKLLLLFLFAQRLYHVVPLPKVATSQQTHIETCGQVVYRRKMSDGDWHLTLIYGSSKLVLEFIPGLALVPPSKGTWVRVRGIRRYDDDHNWPEIHPVESWTPASTRCLRETVHVPR